LTLLERYIGTTMLKGTGISLVVMVVLLVFFGLIDESEDVGQGNYGLGDAFFVALLSAPRYVFEVFPVAAMMGSLIGLGAMGEHGELTAMRGFGFSLRQIILAVLKTGLLMMLAVFLFGEFVAPASEQWGEQHRTEQLEERVTLKTRYGFWARDGKAFVNIRSILPGARLENIFVYEFDDARQLRLATHAASAEHRGDHWLMREIRQSEISEKGIRQRRLASARWESILDPGLLNAVVIQPTMLPITELLNYVQVMRRSKLSSTEYEVALWLKVATPLATMVMLFVAIPFVLAHQRYLSMGQRVFLGLTLGMAFYLLSRGMSYVAVVYEVNPMLSALTPAMVFLLIGISVLKRVR
jgi:lipopolysaccharide export system permease protein